MTQYTTDLPGLIKELQTDEKNGLNAAKIEAARSVYGENKLREKKKKSILARFLDQFKDVMIIILLVAAAVSFVIACTEGEAKEFFEPLLIVAIVVLNAIMGVFQENKAEAALDALKSMSALHAKVIRDGNAAVIDASELVPGDIITLEAGDFIPADARIIKASSLKSEESALTGESVPSEKFSDRPVEEKAPLGDRTNMLYSGCSITYGTATAVVTATGMKTEMGKIAGMLENEKESATPLQKKLSQLGKYLGIAALLACAVIFTVGLLDGMKLIDIFMIAVSLAVSAIPEGLPAIVTIVLSIGVQRMVKRNAIIRRLPAVETLGSASVICSDKTGTLTQNRMTLVGAYSDGMSECETITDDCSDEIKKLLEMATLCCDGEVTVDGDEVKHIGDPTETSIVYAALKNGMTKSALYDKYLRVTELPFDSDRKMMSVVVEASHDGVPSLLVITKGAFDILSSRCISGDTEKGRAVCESMSENALRVLAVAYKYIDALPVNFTNEQIESKLTFAGLVGMIDPPREECKTAVATCRDAGIRPVMITGDHVVTAAAIARELGIIEPGKPQSNRAITGAQLQAMTDEQLDNEIENISVYARVSPEDKIRIVKAWQRKDKVVSMTGDGVNDAPALKAADIGCAMGITGTDVAKGAADMTLTDDNFATIVHAVSEGRGIYDNIKKVVGYLLGTNIGEIFTVFFAMLIFRQTPLLSMQLLWVNLVTDSLPAIALGREKVESDVMKRPPKPKSEGIFAHGYAVQILLQGVMFAVMTLAAFFVGQHFGDSASLAAGQTMAFIVLATTQIFQAFNMRSQKSLFKTGVFGNKFLNLSALAAAGLMAIVLFTPLRMAFELILLPWQMYLIAVILALLPTVVMEISKNIGFIREIPHGIHK